MLDGITIFQPKGRVIKKYRSIIEEFESKYKMESSFGTIFTFTVMDIINKGIRNTGLVPKKLKHTWKNQEFTTTVTEKFTWTNSETVLRAIIKFMK